MGAETGRRREAPPHRKGAAVTEPSTRDRVAPATPADIPWDWAVEGMEVRSSPGSMEHVLTDSGTVRAELAGDVVVWLAEHGSFWDSLDTGQPFTLRIGPGGE